MRKGTTAIQNVANFLPSLNVIKITFSAMATTLLLRFRGRNGTKGAKKPGRQVGVMGVLCLFFVRYLADIALLLGG